MTVELLDVQLLQPTTLYEAMRWKYTQQWQQDDESYSCAVHCIRWLHYAICLCSHSDPQFLGSIDGIMQCSGHLAAKYFCKLKL